MSTLEFKKWGKIARLNRDCIITEKIDGTNAQVVVEHSVLVPAELLGKVVAVVGDYSILAGSRKRYITPQKDNFGFAQWVFNNAEKLLGLGPGRHYGEWWGQGIQRKYGMDRKVFSLFNVTMWGDDRPECCDVVPVLYTGPFHSKAIKDVLQGLRDGGSVAAPRFDKPEGIVVFHTHGNYLFKVTLENDEVPKSLVEKAETTMALKGATEEYHKQKEK